MTRKLTTLFTVICIFNAFHTLLAQSAPSIEDGIIQFSLNAETSDNTTSIVTLDNPTPIKDDDIKDESEHLPVIEETNQIDDELLHDLDNTEGLVTEGDSNTNSTSSVSQDQENSSKVEGDGEDKIFIPGAPEAPETLINNSYSLKNLVAGMFVVVFVIFVAFTCHYRIQMQRYKMAPFTPPRFCPEFLFPRAYTEKKNAAEDNRTYQAIEVGDYHPPNVHRELEF